MKWTAVPASGPGPAFHYRGLECASRLTIADNPGLRGWHHSTSIADETNGAAVQLATALAASLVPGLKAARSIARLRRLVSI